MATSFADLERRIAAERRRRLAGASGIGTWHYWRARGDDGPPPEEYWCAYCAGWYGVPHDMTHQRGSLCRLMGTRQCACIDCWVADGRSEAGPAHVPARPSKRRKTADTRTRQETP